MNENRWKSVWEKCAVNMEILSGGYRRNYYRIKEM